MKRFGFFLILLAITLLAFQTTARAQTNTSIILVMTANGPIEPAMEEYIARGVKTAEQRNVEALVIQLDTPGGSIETMKEIITDIRASTVPVIVYVTPRGAMAASAGTLITLAGHASAMAPETIIGAASPVDSSGGDLDSTLKAKQTEALKAIVRTLAERRGTEAVTLAEDMIDHARAVSADEALKVHLVDFIATDLNDLLKKLDGFSVAMQDGNRTLHTANATTEPLDMSLIEELLLILTDSNIVFILLSLGILAIQIELSHPGAWVPGFTG
ncbi:MAG TPA: ATP-dependent Clp protease proteolytic subunit, partial [Anaerolineales bacterium]|nr:ATP-dependent Clp protease proteolytic subunit [Anaerolineales bacterium]